MTKAYLMTSLVEKMQFMGLNDLMNEIKQDQTCFVGDEAVENKVLMQVLALVEDKISEVKNQAVKCLGQLIKIIRQPQMETVVDKLIDFSGGQDEELPLKTITAELPRDGKIAATACSKLTPKLLGQISNPTTPPEALVETLAILTILISRFPAISPAPLCYLFTDLLATHVFPFLAPNANLEKQRTTVHLIAAVARTAPTQIAPVLAEIVPGVLKAGGLQALEALLLRCPTEITPYVAPITQTGIQYIKYDPNYAGDDEDEEMADADDDDDEAELDEYSDDEDTSYKIRRSATKLLAAIVGTRPDLLSSIYKDVSPVLISRFGDREETVRLEVWATYVVLLNQTALYASQPQTKAPEDSSLKRKRDPETMDVPSLSKALLNQLKSAKTPPATLQAGFALLHTLLDVLPGSLASQVASIAATSKSILAQPAKHFDPRHSIWRAGGEWAEAVYEQAVARLTAHDTDAEVRACAEACVGDLWVCATDVVRSRDRREWEAICRAGAKTEGAVKVVTPVGDGVAEAWRARCVGLHFPMYLSADGFSSSYTEGVPAALPPALVPQIKPYLSTSDIPLLSQGLSLLALLLELAPTTTFCAALVSADNQIATHLVPNLVIAVEKAPKADASPSNVAKAVAQIVKSQQAIAAGTIAQYAKNIKKTSKAKTQTVVLSLLILGELGRFIDMSNQQDIFRDAIEHFAGEQEEIRAAASFAAGNIAIGNLPQFLPAIVKIVKSDPKKRLLSLHALKEACVVTHCSQGQLEGVADLLWVPLFENSENSEETTRNVAAACLGKLATTHPSRYLPQLHARVQDPSADARATVVSAIRYTFAETSSSYDELLAPLLVDFLSLMLDEDLTPHLIREHLPALLPSLYRETIINPDLIRTVDDGLDARKTAYETMYTLLDTCLAKLELPTFLGRTRSRWLPLLSRRSWTRQRPNWRRTMKGATVTKDTVKQDLERAAELQRSALRAVAALSKIAGNGASPRFDAFVEELKKNPQWGSEFKELAAQA
ncbi:Cullin-associated nedd8-dissociated protein 1 [Favolaschia claudopus]|uniref:Cullin-associated nedd8-dissociated protein 1 n=1 Tax=Favolaschia claudopus TaxID=2862362 RepID=A0AAW0CJ48_9AGAR